MHMVGQNDLFQIMENEQGFHQYIFQQFHQLHPESFVVVGVQYFEPLLSFLAALILWSYCVVVGVRGIVCIVFVAYKRMWLGSVRHAHAQQQRILLKIAFF